MGEAKRIDGFERYGSALPGIGPVLAVAGLVDGVMAIRADETGIPAAYFMPRGSREWVTSPQHQHTGRSAFNRLAGALAAHCSYFDNHQTTPSQEFRKIEKRFEHVKNDAEWGRLVINEWRDHLSHLETSSVDA